MARGSRFAALAGGAALIALSASPALAATVVSQATAQALASSSGGQSTATPTLKATNDGTREYVTNPDPTPFIATSNPAVSDVAPQLARAYEDGTSTACAGLTGPASQGVTNLTSTGCTIEAKEFKLHLADLDLTTLLKSANVVSGALATIPGLSALPTGVTLDSLTSALTGAIGASSLGSLQITADLGSIQGRCAADPARAVGSAQILNGDTASTQPAAFAVTIPTATGGVQTLPIVELPANPAPNTHVTSSFDSVVTALTDALTAELNTVVGNELSTLGVLNVGGLADTLRTTVVNALLSSLSPVTQQLKLNLVDVTLNKQVVSAGGRQIDVSALDGLLIPLTASATDPSTVMLTIGHVTCGVNTRLRAAPVAPAAIVTPTPDVPMSIDAGRANSSSWSEADSIAAVTATLTAMTLVGIVGYRRGQR